MSKSPSYDTPPAVVFAVGLLGIGLGTWLLAIRVLTLFALLFIVAGGGAILVWYFRRSPVIHAMTPEIALILKRLISGALGAFGFIVFAAVVRDVSRDILSASRRTYVLGLSAMLAGAVLAPLLLTHWKRWANLKPSDRGPAFFLVALLAPALVALPFGLFGGGFVSGGLAMGVTGLWWAINGHKATSRRPPPAA